jgi:hypothetical protein
MSLDVTLLGPEESARCSTCGAAQTVRPELFEANITHNLNAMAEAAGIYRELWLPDEIGITKARQLIQPLETGLSWLKADPEKFKKYNATNGWGLYEHFVPWVESYLDACKANPDADVKVSR